MSTLPTRFASVILPVASLFRQRTWRHAQRLLLGAILAPGVRTVTAVLRVLGLRGEPRFVNYHRVLNRAVWSSRQAARLLLGLLVRTFVPHGPILLGLDDTIERRRGQRIRAKGIYRDPVRSSRAHVVKASGLRWLSLMLLAPIPWAGRVWALPFLTVLAPSERYDRERGARHKRLTDWARQLVGQARRWLPGRSLVLVADTTFAALDLLAALAGHLTGITRLRLDAALYAPAPARRPGIPGRPRTKGARRPPLTHVLAAPATRWRRVTVAGWDGATARGVALTSGTAVWDHPGRPVLPIRWVLIRDPRGHFDPQALLCTDPAQDAVQIVQWFVWRWQVEVTFQETRRHLGVETQRQWSDRAIARTTPVLLGVFSLVTLCAARLAPRGRVPVRSAAWYPKPQPTFSDTLAVVRRHCWRSMAFAMSRTTRHAQQLPRPLVTHLTEALCDAA